MNKKTQIQKKVSALMKVKIEIGMNALDLIVLYLFLEAALKALEVPKDVESGLREGTDGFKEALAEVIDLKGLIPMQVKIKDEYR